MKDISKEKRAKRESRRRRIRARVIGDAAKPRLSVFRSNQYVWAQIIDDTKGTTLVSASSKDIAAKKGQSKAAVAKQTGADLAKKAVEKGIKTVVFDRGGYRYHGRIKEFAEGAREKGLQF
jgi:large subunit ribosomal protein L18